MPGMLALLIVALNRWFGLVATGVWAARPTFARLRRPWQSTVSALRRRNLFGQHRSWMGAARMQLAPEANNRLGRWAWAVERPAAPTDALLLQRLRTRR